MSTFSVELLTLEDASAIAVLFQRVWPYLTEFPLTWRNQRALSAKEIRQEMQEGFYYYGIRVRAQIIGVYKLTIGNEILGEQQVVDPDYRRKGVARLMYDQFLQLGHQLNKPNCINLLLSNNTMIDFVSQLGFLPFGAPYEQHPGMLVQKYIIHHEQECITD